MSYESRWEFIRPHVEGKRVLEIGPAELVGTTNRDKFDRWIHHKISKVAARLVGVEYSAEQVRALCELGYDIRQGDAENFDLGERFEVVVAGELIEHLSNPGQFLERVKQHLVDGGKLVLTTPNRYNILKIYNVARTGKVPQYKKNIAKHVVYFDSDALTSLLTRHNFARTEIAYCKWVGEPSARWTSRLLVKLASAHRPVLSPVLLAVAHK